jgi:hypothetical protein
MDAAAAKHMEQGGVICREFRGVYSKEETHAIKVHREVCAFRHCQAELKQKNKRSRQAEIKRLLATRQERKVSAENQERLELSRCEFTFGDFEDAADISFLLDRGKVVVESVDRARKLVAFFVLPKTHRRARYSSGRNSAGFFGCISNAMASACPVSPLILTFRKPTPDTPPHADARKSLTMKARCSMKTEATSSTRPQLEEAVLKGIFP